jgi:hypothetical protein
VNVITYNYRGYSQSQGCPTIDNIKADGVVVAQYARCRVGPDAKIGAHGQSIGGSVACHLAREGLLSFVYVDRSFSGLDMVPRFSMGKWSYFGIRILTGIWNQDSSEDYIYSNCYKVIGQDPNDEVISELASLKRGVARKSLIKEIMSLEDLD